jgi:hypothetical protein
LLDVTEATWSAASRLRSMRQIESARRDNLVLLDEMEVAFAPSESLFSELQTTLSL